MFESSMGLVVGVQNAAPVRYRFNNTLKELHPSESAVWKPPLMRLEKQPLSPNIGGEGLG